MKYHAVWRHAVNLPTRTALKRVGKRRAWREPCCFMLPISSLLSTTAMFVFALILWTIVRIQTNLPATSFLFLLLHFCLLPLLILFPLPLLLVLPLFAYSKLSQRTWKLHSLNRRTDFHSRDDRLLAWAGSHAVSSCVVTSLPRHWHYLSPGDVHLLKVPVSRSLLWLFLLFCLSASLPLSSPHPDSLPRPIIVSPYPNKLVVLTPWQSPVLLDAYLGRVCPRYPLRHFLSFGHMISSQVLNWETRKSGKQRRISFFPVDGQSGGVT